MLVAIEDPCLSEALGLATRRSLLLPSLRGFVPLVLGREHRSTPKFVYAAFLAYQQTTCIRVRIRTFVRNDVYSCAVQAYLGGVMIFAANTSDWWLALLRMGNGKQMLSLNSAGVTHLLKQKQVHAAVAWRSSRACVRVGARLPRGFSQEILKSGLVSSPGEQRKSRAG